MNKQFVSFLLFPSIVLAGEGGGAFDIESYTTATGYFFMVLVLVFFCILLYYSAQRKEYIPEFQPVINNERKYFSAYEADGITYYMTLLLIILQAAILIIHIL